MGDPREIERRKAERARAAVPPDVRAEQARGPSSSGRMISNKTLAGCLPVEPGVCGTACMHQRMHEAAMLTQHMRAANIRWRRSGRPRGRRGRVRRPRRDKPAAEGGRQVIAGLKREIAQLGGRPL